ncbi:uncharacterized protein DUF87 [Solirubrobacter pauli]|uniref:Uncharacterized protein DUF87 n=1 Tax=Solirubrobacter pauli TaxID=166793 RepID=A0A660LA09_9ACTN|nr:ATP-binding protein [Solirubrobacter pauli]RKQ91832.1 uncharacterized protein DUF87 [Solirubrobacter pauli]
MRIGSTTDGAPLDLDPADLTTHGVIVGMTGSGKTGLAIVLLEEVLAAGIPALILDPKGDMGNLAGDDVTIYTPGSEAGVPLNLIGSLAPPPLSWDSEAEALRDEIESIVTSLLGLVGITADPLASREFVLLANLIEHAWRAGRAYDLATLIGEIGSPPLRKLGVFDVDVFFPPKDRMALAMRLNGLAASPSFAAWSAGAPLDVGALLNGPRASIVYLAHLSEEERQFAVTLVLSKLVTWMRGQPGSTDLRALVYMDEVFGFAPPTATPPAKAPILTILKQARAYGVGMVLATQNPVDLDYKAMANAGTWMVGRLQTENDKARVLEGLRSAAGGADIGALDAAIGGLAKRQFMLVSARANQPVVFGTRDTHSTLSGPLTREQIAAVTPDVPIPAPVAAPGPGVNGTPVAPPVADGVPVGWAGSGRLRAYLRAQVSVRYDDPGVDELSRFEAAYGPLDEGFDVAREVALSTPVGETAPVGAEYVLPSVPIGDRAFFRDAEQAIERHVVAERPLPLQRNAKLKLLSRPGETAEAFAARCDLAAQEAADAETAKLRDRLETRQNRFERALETARRRVEDLTYEERTQQAEQLAAGAGALLGALMGGRRRTRSIAGALGRSSRTAAKRRVAEAKVADATDDLLEVEREIETAVLEIDAKWRAIGDAIEPAAIRAEASDVAVERLSLVWAP